LSDRGGSIRYVQALRARWPLIVALVAVAVAAATAYSLTASKRYEASTDILVSPLSSGDQTFVGFSLLRESLTQGQAVITLARIALAPQVVNRVDRKLQVKDAASLVSVTPLGQSNVVTIKSSASSPERAALISNTFATQLTKLRKQTFQSELRTRVHELRARLAAIPKAERSRDFESVAIQQNLAQLTPLLGQADPTLRVLSRAVPPESAVWPRPVLSVLVALLAALLLGAGAAVALDVGDPRIAREDELTSVHRLPILARVPKLRRSDLRSLARREPLPAAALKPHRVLRANLAAAGPDLRPPKTIVVVSAQSGDGKSLTASQLASAMAAGGSSVVLVDWDVHRPTIGRLMGAWGRPAALAQALTDPSSVAACLVPAPGHGGRLQLLLASSEQAYLTRHLDADRVQALIDALRPMCDVIVMDSPPVLEVAEAVVVADAADAVVIAVRLGHTRRDRLVDLRRMLARRRISPVGFVVTEKRRRRRTESAYYSDDEPADNLSTVRRRRSSTLRARPATSRKA